MKIVIIEDETAAARNLQSLIGRVIPDGEVVRVLESISETVEWFAANACPDILFMDIHLADGNAFAIFDRIDIPCPVVFTTAYDEYALEAFKVNSIDYILKPIKEEELHRAIDKLQRLSGSELAARSSVVAEMARARDEQKVFLIPVRDKIIPLKISDVAFFYTADERVRAFDYKGGSFPMDRSLDRLLKGISEVDFFRANRQFIIAREAITEITVWFGSRLSPVLKVKTPERIVISKDRVREFKQWFKGS